MTRSSRTRLCRKRPRFQLRYLQGAAPFTGDTSPPLPYPTLWLRFQGPLLWDAGSSLPFSILSSKLPVTGIATSCHSAMERSSHCCAVRPDSWSNADTWEHNAVGIASPLACSRHTGWLACVLVGLQAAAVSRSNMLLACRHTSVGEAPQRECYSLQPPGPPRSCHQTNLGSPQVLLNEPACIM